MWNYSETHPMRITTSDPDILHLAGPLEIYTVAEVRQALLARLMLGAPLRLDLQSVQTCDPAGLQVLCSARRSALEAGIPFEVGPLPPAVTECAARLGLSLDCLSAPSKP